MKESSAEVFQGMMTDPWWRLNNLYWIQNKSGNVVKFKPNWAQTELYEQQHSLNLVLKARQLGCTTMIDLMMLDCCLFNPNTQGGIIAHHRDDASKIFRTKILFPYRSMYAGIQSRVPADAESKQEIDFQHGSSIRVGTSLRSSTLQRLHVSEYGISCARFPEKANEIKTGALNTVQAGQIIHIESTSKGKIGHFYQLWEDAYDLFQKMAPLSELDWKIFFFPWWKQEEYSIDPRGVVVGAEDEKYFRDLAQKSGVNLSSNQKAWYIKKRSTLGPAMKQEYPSTPDEAWESGGLLLNWNRRYHELETAPWPPPENYEIFMSMDYGFSRPFAVLWFYTDYDGRVILAREWYGWNQNPNEGIRLTASEIAEGIRDREKQWGIWGRVKRRIAGSDCFSRRLNPKTGELGPPIANDFSEVDPLLSLEQANDKNRLACVSQCHKRLRIKFDEDGNLIERPMFQVCRDACPQFLRTVPSIASDPLNPEDAWTDGEDHAFDAWKYALMSWPMASREPAKPKTFFDRIREQVEAPVRDFNRLPWQVGETAEDGGFFQDEGGVW